MFKIEQVIGREILDSRGLPTVEAEVRLEGGVSGLASVPSGSSVGQRECLELRDGDNDRYLGKGVLRSVGLIGDIISRSLVGKNAEDQALVDSIMIDLDGTENKSRLGANTILAVSLAIARASAKFKQVEFYEHVADLYGRSDIPSLPRLMMNILNGGKHAGNNVDIQEFMVRPISTSTIRESVRMGSEIFHSLGMLLRRRGLNTNLGDEGGYAPDLGSNASALDLIVESVEMACYVPGVDVDLAVDCASSVLFDEVERKYVLRGERKAFTSEEFSTYLGHLVDRYPIFSIEDGLSELDWDGFAHHTRMLGDRIQVVGDDLFVTNSNLLEEGIRRGVANSVLIKPNQVGSLTETLETIRMARKGGYRVIISHRSGETEDVSIADIAVGTGAECIKAGSVSRSERTSKYNRLMRIEERLSGRLCTT